MWGEMTISEVLLDDEGIGLRRRETGQAGPCNGHCVRYRHVHPKVRIERVHGVVGHLRLGIWIRSRTERSGR